MGMTNNEGAPGRSMSEFFGGTFKKAGKAARALTASCGSLKKDVDKLQADDTVKTAIKERILAGRDAASQPATLSQQIRICASYLKSPLLSDTSLSEFDLIMDGLEISHPV